VAGGIGALFWWVRRPVAYSRGSSHAPLPLFSHAKAAVWVRDDDEGEDTTSDVIATRASRNGHAAAATVPSWSVPLPDITRAASRQAAPVTSSGPSSAPSSAPSSTVSSSPTLAQPSVQFSVPTDATLQFLPGRLEILSGAEQGREIRLVRLPSDAETRITFGRRAGAPYRHVQLRDATVSRDHAALHLRAGEWCLVSHSSTNPVQVNGVELATHEDAILRDGDRVDMGEVTFRFRD
jgi:hypothetical protein